MSYVFNSDKPATPNAEANLQPAVQYLLVAVGEHRYGVRLDTLQEVVRNDQLSVAPIPNSPEWLDGISSLRGSIVSTINLRAFFGLGRQVENVASNTLLSLQLPSFGRSTPRLLVVSTSDLTVGLVVDNIEGVVFVQPEQIRALDGVASHADDPAMPYLEGIYKDTENQREIALLDLRRLITSPQLFRLETASV